MTDDLDRALFASRHFNARTQARAFAQQVRQDVSTTLGDMLLKWANHGMTKEEMLKRLSAAMEQADRS
jgi:hypothetical protein